MLIFARKTKKFYYTSAFQLQCHPYVHKQKNVIFKFKLKFYL